MTTDNEATTPAQTVLPPPNGHFVGGEELYAALYKMDIAAADRHNSIVTQIEGVRTDHRQLRSEFATHTKDGHPLVDHAEVVKEEIKLDAKKASIAAGLLAFAASIFAWLRGVHPF